jgi:hypothetical protein
MPVDNTAIMVGETTVIGSSMCFNNITIEKEVSVRVGIQAMQMCASWIVI